MAIAAAVSLIAMIGPLVACNWHGLAFGGAREIVIAGASLGLGFMFVKVGAMQSLTLYPGDPMYSLMVVLGGLLLWTGLGSLASGRLTSWPPLRRAVVGMVVTSVLVGLWPLIMGPATQATLPLALPYRILIVFGSLLPLGFFIGFPFAALITHLYNAKPTAVPWLRGIIGLTSVLASVLAVVVAMRSGFSAVMYLACAVYALGAIAVYRHAIDCIDSAWSSANAQQLGLASQMPEGFAGLPRESRGGAQLGRLGQSAAIVDSD